MANLHDSAIQNGDVNSALSQAEGSLQDILQVAVRHRWTILLTTAFFVTIAFVHLLKATPIYRSESRLYVEQSGPRIMSEYEGVMARSGNYLYTQGELLKSTPVIGPVVDDPKIARLRTFAGAGDLVASLRKNLNVSIGRKDDVITVSFESPYPVEAAQIVNDLVRSYVAYHAERKRDTASEVLKILQKEKESRDAQLSAKLEEMIAFTEENGIVSFDGNGGNIVFERLRTLSAELSDAEMATLTAKADLDAVLSMEGDADKIRQFAAASVGQSVRVPDRETQLQAELRQAENELKDARYHCTEEHPAVQAIKAKIDRIIGELDREAREFADAYVEVMRLRYTTAQEREDEVLASFESQHRDAKVFGVLAARYSLLQSDLARAERICEIVDNRIKELNVTTQDVEALRISTLEVARPAESPSKPEKSRILAMALVLGILSGGGMAFLRDWLDFRLRSSEEVSAILGIPVLGVVPKMSTKKAAGRLGHVWIKQAVSGDDGETEVSGVVVASGGKSIRTGEGVTGETETVDAAASEHRIPLELDSVRWVRRVSRKSGRSARTAMARGGVPGQGNAATAGMLTDSSVEPTRDRPEIVIRGQKVHLESRSVVAEAYRTIRTAIFFGAPKDEAKTILITSPAPGDGKSTLASNLAIAMAQAGQKTLIIDADFRKPVQHKIFEVDDDKGLSSVLVGRDAIEQAVQAGIGDSLDILACGPEVPNPSELLNSDGFNATLTKLTEQYDRIIVDSPPVGPVADAQILAAICDITVLVLRAEKSTRRQAQHARDSLLSVGSQLLGAVVNDVPQKGGQYGYYSSYGNYGYYGKREKKTG